MEKDIFCSLYGAWKKEGKIIYENDEVYSILSVTPALPLHASIIMKRHVVDESEISAKEAGKIFEGIKGTFDAICALEKDEIISFYTSLKSNPPVKESAALAEAMLNDPDLLKKPLAYNIGINKGKEAGQLVSHYHLHLFPIRKPGAGIVTAMREQYKNSNL